MVTQLSPGRKYKILLVDDDRFISDIYALKFSKAGHNLVVANSVNDAIKKLQEGNDYDAIATDLIMPGRDGFEFLQEAGEAGLLGDSVIIVLSNQDSRDVKEKFKALGAVEHVVKAHAMPNEVLNIVQCTIDRHKYNSSDTTCPNV